jgi:hypothetical protein
MLAYGDERRHLELGTPVDVLDAGSHKPLLCKLEDEDGAPAGDWIVKTPSMYAHGASSLLREVIGSDLAAFAGLPTPAIGLLRLPDPPAATDASDVGARAAAVYRADAGQLAFCSRKLGAPTLEPSVLRRPGRPRSQLVHDAVFTFLFDVFMWHYDRTWKNPNLLLLDHRLVVIDHDRVCHGVESVDETGLAPDYTSFGHEAALVDHVLRPFLKRQVAHVAWHEFRDRMASLDGVTLDEMAAGWPDELDRGRTGATVDLKADVVRFLRARVSVVDRIVEEARSVVA